MGIRTRFDELVQGEFGQKLNQKIVRPFEQRLSGKLVDLRAQFPWKMKDLARELWQRPRSLGGLLEENSPWLSRQVLGAASNVAEPFVAGMGLQVKDLGEDSVTISMPGWWRNQGEGGFTHVGALCTFAEFSSRIYWEYHLDLRRSEMSLLRLELRPLGTGARTGLNQLKVALQARYHVPVTERERLLHELRLNGHVNVDGEVAVYDEAQKLVAQLTVEWRLHRQLSLGEVKND